MHGPHGIDPGSWRGEGESLLHLAMSFGAEREPEHRNDGVLARPRRRRVCPPPSVIAVVAGGSMLVAPTIAPSEQASVLYIVKILMSLAGFVVFCLGALMYLYSLVRDRKEAAARSRWASGGSERGQAVSEKPT